MRSCFVPNCDILCKSKPKRMMFIPPKDQQLFKMWRSVLPNRRELKPTDRVCERHFNEADIVKTFDHIINGVLHQIDRGKPKLRPAAVPSYNLPTDNSRDFIIKHEEASEPHRKSKKQSGLARPILSEDSSSTKARRPIIKRLNKDFAKKLKKEKVDRYDELDGMSESVDDDRLLDDVHSTADDHDIAEQHSNAALQETSLELQVDTVMETPPYLTQSNNERTDCLKSEELAYDCMDASIFDGIYEDVYEVTLPNTLWGLHRDPNRTFIVFSYFDATTCSTSKLIHLDSGMNTTIHIHGKMVNRYQANLSIEYLTSLVTLVDEYRVCEKFDPNSRCEVVAVESCNLCTFCQSSKV